MNLPIHAPSLAGPAYPPSALPKCGACPKHKTEGWEGCCCYTMEPRVHACVGQPAGAALLEPQLQVWRQAALA